MMIRILIVCLLVIFCAKFAQAAITPTYIEELIFAGKMTQAKKAIRLELKNTALKKHLKANLYHTYGDIARIEGDIDEALVYWNKAAEIRDVIYPQKDYHHAWKYAHLSNYYYQKFKPRLAGIYADSCFSIIQKLTIEQQKELEVYKIWNILAQSVKQQAGQLEDDEFFKIYERVNELYNQSVEFQLTHNTHPYYLAKTYHLLGNTGIDKMVRYRNKKNWKRVSFEESRAIQNYDKAITIWKELFGEKYFEHGKTLFLKGLLFFYLTEHDSGYLSRALLEFERAFNAFGLNDSSNIDLDRIPNKEDLLMFLKYYTNTLLAMHQEVINPKGSLNKAEEINQIAITVWEEVHNSFKSNNINQNLAIYNLIPHQEGISILRRLNAKSDTGTIDEIFRANQKLKYYDLFKASSAQEEISIRALQDKLSPKQVFMDISFNHPNDELILIIISRNDANLSVVSNSIKPIIKTLNESILEVNYSMFVEASRQLYDTFFGTINHDFEEVVICPDGMTNDIPFEALLVSETNINTKDYRKLDYLISHKSVRYVMTPLSFSNEFVKANWSFSIFTPAFNNSEFAELPFSQKLGANLNTKLKINWFDGEHATTASFLNNNDEVVHLSTHSIVDEDETSNHVMLSDNAFYQTEFEKLSKIPLLMVLNSCNSGKGNHLPGDGIDGIVRELHRLGISSTIANQWEVDDKVSNEIFEHFYLELSEGVLSIEAMRKAKLAHIKNAPSSELGAPYYWAGHKVVGVQISLEKSTEIQKLIAVGLLILLLITIFLSKKLKHNLRI